MQSKHIKRDYSAHKKSTYRPYDEYVKLEIFSFDPKYTRTYIAEDNTLKPSKNATKTSWKAWACYKSTDAQNNMRFDLDYTAITNGTYRIDILYEFNTDIYHDAKKDTGAFLLGKFNIDDGDELSFKFSGVNNALKRIPIYRRLAKGKHKLHIQVTHNCYLIGFIVRKQLSFLGDNYYGDNLGKEDGNLILTSATLTQSNMTKPSELSCKIAYDDALECNESPSGFYIDYMDEVNFYVKDDNREIIR